jgi:hypothetical protein
MLHDLISVKSIDLSSRQFTEQASSNSNVSDLYFREGVRVSCPEDIRRFRQSLVQLPEYYTQIKLCLIPTDFHFVLH